MKRALSILSTAGMIIAIAVSALVAACKQEVAASGQATTANAPARQSAASPKVAKIVFIGKQNACDCTRKRVAESFAALQKATEDRSDIALEQLQVDVDEEGVARYQELRPIMVLPAIYLLEGSGTLVEVLQGEVTVEQVRKAIGG
jgi:hypothetical protein